MTAPGEAESRQDIIAANAGPGAGGRRRSDGRRNRHGGGTSRHPWRRRAPSPLRRATSQPRGAPTTYFWDPDVIAVDPSFNGLAQPNAPIQRLYTGVLWAEGPAWSAQGRYLVWSDIPNNRQMRWSEDDGRVSVFRTPSNNSNGNTFDFQGRQLSCEHLTRRVVRYEHDGTVDRDRRRLSTARSSTRRTTSCRIPTAATGSPIRPMAASSTKASRMSRAARATPPAGSIRASASLPASCPAAASCRPTAIASIRPGASTWSSARTRCPIRTGSASRTTTRSSTSPRPARVRATPGRAARATSTCSTSAPTTSCRTTRCSPTAWSTA